MIWNICEQVQLGRKNFRLAPKFMVAIHGFGVIIVEVEEFWTI